MSIYRDLFILMVFVEGSSVAGDAARESQFLAPMHLSSYPAHEGEDFSAMNGMQQALTRMPSAMQQQLGQAIGNVGLDIENTASLPSGLPRIGGVQSGFGAIVQQMLPNIVTPPGSIEGASINGVTTPLLQSKGMEISGRNVDSNQVPNWGGMMKLPPQLEQMQASLRPPNPTQIEEISQKVSLPEMMRPQLDMLGIDAKEVFSAPGRPVLHQHLMQTDAKGGVSLQSSSKFTGVPGIPLQGGMGGLSAAVGMYSPYVNPFIFPLTPHKYMPPPPGPAPYPMPSFNPPNYYNPSNDFVGL